MKWTFILLVINAGLIFGCAPSDEAPPAIEATPTATASDATITDMDFESGEVEPTAVPSGENISEAAPDEE